MYDSVAIGTDWNQVFHRINLIFLIDLREGRDVVYLNDAFSHIAIGCLEIEAAHGAIATVASNTFFSGIKIALISVDCNRIPLAFKVVVNFLGELNVFLF